MYSGTMISELIFRTLREKGADETLRSDSVEPSPDKVSIPDALPTRSFFACLGVFVRPGGRAGGLADWWMGVCVSVCARVCARMRGTKTTTHPPTPRHPHPN